MVSGELEVELRWVRSQLTFIPEPLYKLHIGDMSAAIQTRDEQWRIAVIILLVDASALPKKIAYCGDFTLVARKRQ